MTMFGVWIEYLYGDSVWLVEDETGNPAGYESRAEAAEAVKYLTKKTAGSGIRYSVRQFDYWPPNVH